MNWLCELRDKYFGEVSTLAFKLAGNSKSSKQNAQREVQKLRDLVNNKQAVE
jgi:hypothetical protein